MLRNRVVAVLVAGGLLGLGAAARAGEAPGLVGHWRLAVDADDSSSNGLDAANHGVVFQTKGPDGTAQASAFDGKGAHLVVKPSEKLRLGSGDFSVALWVHASDASGGDPGDLVTLFDESSRTGFNLSLRTNTGVTSNTANVRQLQFGIDAGSAPKWSDEGRPGGAILAIAMAVHEGQLYAGTGDNAPGALGRVYRYDGERKWVDCGAPDRCNAVFSLISHEGKLYAGTAKYRFGGSALVESDNMNPGGGIFRYDGGTTWTEVGRLPGVEAIGGMVTFNGQLYVSSLYRPAGFFRYESDGSWTSLPVPEGDKRVESLAVFGDHLWAGTYDGGRVYRYDGKAWEDLGLIGDNTQTYSFTPYRGRLCVGTWPSGRVYRWEDNRWEDLGRMGDEREVMGMLVHNGKLYGGSLPLAAVFRYDGGQNWTNTAQLDTTPDVTYRRAWTMAEFGGRLFCSTLPSGVIHAMEAGAVVSHDHALPPGWQHVAAVKRGGSLALYVNGQRVAESRPFDPAALDLSNDSPMRIGAGAGGNFQGALSDLRLYDRALTDAEISTLAKP